MRRARYITLEGTEGVGKTTQTQKLVDALRLKGYKVLQTKEPGTSLSPLTMKLRGIMLDNQYNHQMTLTAREMISQAIRSIHIEHIIIPALTEYDFIIQDRGLLSGFAYGTACGNNLEFIETLVDAIMPDDINAYRLYDDVIFLTGNVSDGLNRALSSKKEFDAGDAMESKGLSFLDDVSDRMRYMSKWFNTLTIAVDGKTIDEVHEEILYNLEIKG
jgi:dTMP kinase